MAVYLQTEKKLYLYLILAIPDMLRTNRISQALVMQQIHKWAAPEMLSSRELILGWRTSTAEFTCHVTYEKSSQC